MSFAQLFLTHTLSLESVLGFCHGIAKGGDCKVEFNQPSCWLYSVPNLLVFQQLATLYLGGFVVRVVSEIEWLNAQECARKQSLVAWSRGWLAAASRQKQHTCQACQKLKRHASWSTTGQNRTTGCSVIARLDLATQSSHKSKPLATLVLKNLAFYILFSPQYKYPLYPQKKESFQREFWERNLRVKQDWFIYNLYIRVSLNSSTLFLFIVKFLRGILPKPFSHHIHYCERAVWCFGKQLGRNQFTLVDAMVK